MKKILAMVLGAALVAVSMSAAADADGSYLFNLGLGEARYHVDKQDAVVDAMDDTDAARALRVGYLWHGPADFGVEGGYVDLGRLTMSSVGNAVFQDATIHARGWILGAVGEYRFAERWFLSARGGWLSTSTDVSYRYADPATSFTADGSLNSDSWYGGVGIGFDVASHASLGLSYDNYHVKGRTEQVSADANVGTFMLTYEYRF